MNSVAKARKSRVLARLLAWRDTLSGLRAMFAPAHRKPLLHADELSSYMARDIGLVDAEDGFSASRAALRRSSRR